MSVDVIRKTVAFVLIVLVQALLLNHIRLFGCATPFLLVYFAIAFPLSFPHWTVVTWCFAIGLANDIFANTPGLTACSMTLIGFLQPFALKLFRTRDADEEMKPSLKTLGLAKFTYYTTAMALVYNMVFFSLEWLRFFDILAWTLSIVGSTILTLALILFVEHLSKR